MISPVISGIVTFHSEGELAAHTLQGMELTRRYAEKVGIIVEFVAVLDCAINETARVVKSSSVLRDYDQIIEVRNRDLGSSRNSGIQAARGNFIGIFDGDDFYSENWLIAALNIAQSFSKECVVHPELQISFGNVHCIAQIVDMNKQPNYPLQNCLAVHPWISCSFAAKSVYQKIPYCRTDTKETGFGFEDWHWNLETIAKGCQHICAYRTAHYYRRKPTSMLTEMVSSGAIIRPTAFFDHPDIWSVQSVCKDQNVSSDNKAEQILEELLPNWAIDGFRKISKIDSDLYPTDEFLEKFFLFKHPIDLEPGEVYAKLFVFLDGFKPEVIAMVSCFDPKSTDSNNNVWNKIKLIQPPKMEGEKTLFISNVSNPEQFPDQIPNHVKFLDFQSFAKNLSEEKQIMVLTRLLLQSPASKIYIDTLPLAWKIVRCYGKSFLALDKEIYISVSCQTPNSVVENCASVWKLLQWDIWEAQTKFYEKHIAELNSIIEEQNNTISSLLSEQDVWRKAVNHLNFLLKLKRKIFRLISAFFFKGN